MDEIDKILTITAEELLRKEGGKEPPNYADCIFRFKQALCLRAFKLSHGKVKGAAKLLKVSTETIKTHVND